jgi:hypothetical protein
VRSPCHPLSLGRPVLLHQVAEAGCCACLSPCCSTEARLGLGLTCAAQLLHGLVDLQIKRWQPPQQAPS